MTDHIEICGLRLVCHVGVGDDERASAQPLELDLDIEADLAAAAASDDVADTIDYGEVSLAVATAVLSVEHALLERVAAVAADAALGVDPAATAVTVTVRKLRPPIPLDVASTAVRLRRSRS
ncbi:dihydroneopterin aldolase [Actinospongicola halichondriae]|uniref:dihydroneopterin aldolase n=1 Tax=Actinospongicola halichondriae TaxID=3236844 RepID=UPI003D375404